MQNTFAYWCPAWKAGFARVLSFFSRKEEKALRKVSQPLCLCVFARVFFLGSLRKKAWSRLRASTLFFSQRREGVKRSLTLRLCVFGRVFFLGSQRKKAWSRLRASNLFFFSQRREGAKKSLSTFASMRLCESIFFYFQRKKAYLL